mmetsp:Transcript_19392/g.38903  ORF Transcript_19392/g.38903 Transcript_19392/m.38903 type:complete len:88 (+) Transcript_19392:340-603(+)
MYVGHGVPGTSGVGRTSCSPDNLKVDGDSLEFVREVGSGRDNETCSFNGDIVGKIKYVGKLVGKFDIVAMREDATVVDDVSEFSSLS